MCFTFRTKHIIMKIQNSDHQKISSINAIPSPSVQIESDSVAKFRVCKNLGVLFLAKKVLLRINQDT